ncbi:3-oxoadipate enol-lactone hydrolase [Nocardia seriolae]|uniref:3-oxoadipate enol-lactone hydrolase n=1 Tax=Nocardia seriolae TaxID=37332 RepID=A0ABC9YPA6_9NOCA|nr:3-oxoadipate enol-lactonase [Nocardia seriolae]GAM45239.1 3-oxoadipate enol-lactone hydrolase [Nocardia seriolae]GAP27261.1 3-oxoadipate enol-lactone hydrolase [Nocardia seriolae]
MVKLSKLSPPLAILYLVPFARAIDAEIHYEDSGGEGPVVLLGHEFLMDRTMFASQQAALTPEFRIVTWDARGHGRTRDEGLPFTYWTSARDALTVLDQLAVERAVVGGISQGGFIALRTALLAPDRVAALVLLSSEAHEPTPAELTNARKFLDKWCEEAPRPALAEYLARWLIGDDDWYRAVWVKRWLARDPNATEVAAGALLGRDSVLDRLPEITCPTLVIHPTRSGVPRAHARELADRLPDARYVEIEGARQTVTMTHPVAVNTAIREFLRDLAIPPLRDCRSASPRGARPGIR